MANAPHHYMIINNNYLFQRQTRNDELCRQLVKEGVVPRWLCPNCQGTRITRSRRRGLFEWLLRAICCYPFRCDLCGHRFMRFSLRGR